MTKFWTIGSGAIWWPNFELIQVALSGGQICNQFKKCHLKLILNYSSWKIYLRYGVNTLGPLCLWQCFWVYSILFFCVYLFNCIHAQYLPAACLSHIIDPRDCSLCNFKVSITIHHSYVGFNILTHSSKNRYSHHVSYSHQSFENIPSVYLLFKICEYRP